MSVEPKTGPQHLAPALRSAANDTPVDFTMKDVAEDPNENKMGNGHKRYNFKSIAVFMGSSKGCYPGTKQQDPIYEQEAEKLGLLIGSHRYRMVYGGGNAGLMGVVSEAALNAGGKLLGVLTDAFVQADDDYIQKTHPHAEEVIVQGIEVRKWKMITEADAFFVFPGGLGSLDELTDAGVEQYQRPYKGKRTVSKPIIVINIDGIYDHTKAQLDVMVERGFAKPIVKELYHFVDSVDEGFRLLQSLQGQPRLGLEEIGNVERRTAFKREPRQPA
jgi:hypothetical protein